MTSKRSFLLLPALAIGLSTAFLSQASAATAIVSFTTGSAFSGFSSDETVGWTFMVGGGGVSISSLGWLDTTPASPLGSTHIVGIWSTSGTLLDSATVAVDGALTGDFRYAALTTPLTLAPGTYVIGGRDTTTDGDFYTASNTALTMGPDITFLQAARSANATGFAFPGTFTANSGGRFGPNFAYTAVPEPGAAALGALAGLALLRRRRR